MTPLISIIIPTYNRVSSLRKLINGISAYTTLSDIEVIIVANGCNDGTVKYARSIGGVFSVIEYQQPLGFNKAFNEGIKHAKGYYIIVLHDDVEILYPPVDYWTDNLLSLMENENVVLTAPWFYNTGLSIDIPSFFCAAFKSQIFREIGYLNDEVGGMAETDLCMRILEAGYDIRVTDNIPVYHVPNQVYNNVNVFNNRYSSVNEYYNRHLRNNPNLSILKEYALQSNHITEFGTGDCTNTVALLNNNVLYTYDKHICDQAKYLAKINTNLHLEETDVLSANIQQTDLLVITFRSYVQLSCELISHFKNVSKNIIICQTEKYGDHDESLYDETDGPQIAIDDFLNNHKEWFCKEIWESHNGMVVLQKKKETDEVSLVFVADSFQQLTDKLKKIEQKNISMGELVVVANGIEEKYRNKLLNYVNVIWLERKRSFSEAKALGIRAAANNIILYVEN